MKFNLNPLKNQRIRSLVLLLVILCGALSLKAQKSSIDIDLLSQIVMEKQDEVKKRVVSNLVVKHARTTNQATYSTLYYALRTLTTEKNKTVMSKELMQYLMDYALVAGFEEYFFNSELELSIEGVNASKTKTDKKELTFILDGISKTQNAGFSGQKKDVLTRDTSSKYWLAVHNFLMDQFYLEFTKNEWLKVRGFFKSDSSFLMNPGNLDYDKVLDTNVKLNIRTQVSGFIAKMNNGALAGTDLYRLIKDVKNIWTEVSGNKKKAAMMVDLLEKAIENPHFKLNKNQIAKSILKLIDTYIILEMSPNDSLNQPYSFKIDVEAVILTLAEKFEQTANYTIPKTGIQVKPFFTIGLNHAMFLNSKDSFKFENETKLVKNMAFAGEKIGVKFVLWDFEYTHSFKPYEPFFYRNSTRYWKNPVVQDPIISNIHLSLYGSGILYSISNLKTENNFKYGIAGAGLGVKFFNDLDLNVSYALPVMMNSTWKEMNKMSFINVGFDIPILEYLGRKN